jgi:hypothetical protein
VTAVATASATFYAIVGNSDYYWRTLAPCRVLGAHARLIPEKGGWYAVTQPNDDSEFPWTQDETGLATYPAHQGSTAVWVRPDLARATHAKAMRQLHGIRVIAETDDNYLADGNQNIYMRENGFGPKERLEHMKAVASMDAMVFSTDWLRDYYWKQLRAEFGRGRLPDAFVCRNHVLEEDWPIVEDYDGPVRVGWMGSPSHVWDVNLAWPALMYANYMGGKTVMVGYDPSGDDHGVEMSGSAAKAADQWRKIGYEHVPWRQMDGTSRMRLPFDIGLCPLLSNSFTLGKSDVKFLEYSIAGAATVASNNPVYNRTIIHGETGLLVGSPSEMIDAVALLMKDRRLRETLVANAQQYVRENRGETQLRQEWTEAING